jgi:hypothetical protein
MQIDHIKEKCGNPNCGCEVEAGHPYCSEYCRSAAEFPDAGSDVPSDRAVCGCGHDGCSEGE